MCGDLKIEKEQCNNISSGLPKCQSKLEWVNEQWMFNPKAYATGDNRCLVMLYKSFVSHHPANMCTVTLPLFLAVCHNIEQKNVRIWYNTKPLGVNSIGRFMSTSTVSGKISNHRCRKMSIINILNNDIHPLFATQVSGHRKMDSLNTYLT